jgi:hypothetical protein
MFALMARHDSDAPLPKLSPKDFRALKEALGTCPICVLRDTIPTDMGLTHGVVYRRSRTSVTMRCEVCGLQWAMTWEKVIQAMKYQEGVYEGWGTSVIRIAEAAAPNRRLPYKPKRARVATPNGSTN